MLNAASNSDDFFIILDQWKEKKTDWNELFILIEHAISKAMEKYRDQFDRLFSTEEKLFKDLEFANPALQAIFLRSTIQGISLEYMLSTKDYPLQQMKEMLISRWS